MTIRLPKETKQQLVESIVRYFEVEMGEEIGNLKASQVLDFCLQEICPSIYNQAIVDAQTYLNDKVDDLGGTCYEPEFSYWKK